MLSYFPLLDILRFIAAFAVMCYHYFSSSFHGNDPFSIFVQYGYLGVELFFIISGFVIFFSVRKPTKEYVLGRFLRLYPLFWVICTITYVATLLFPHADHLSFTLYLQNLLIINNGKVALMVDGSYWTLTIEILFYIYIGLFVFFFGEKKLLYFFIGWLLLSFLTFFGGFQEHLITKLLLTRYTPYFAFGGMLGYFYMNKSTLTKQTKWLLCGALCLTAFLPYYISMILNADTSPVTNAFGMFDTKSNILVLSFFILVPLAVYLSEKVTKKELVQGAKILGGITYPLYILHDKFGSLIAGVSFGIMTWISILTAIGMIVASFYISKYEEIWRKHVYKKIMGWSFFKNTQNKNI